MSKIQTTNKFEKALILFLNAFEDWNLEWVGDKNLCYDAIGKTNKGADCVVEFKFRKKYYASKLLEKSKYDCLMALPDDIVKIYFVSDPKGNYWFWLNKLTELQVFDKYCPQTSYWNNKKKNKEVYLLTEEKASRIQKNQKNL